MSGSDMILTCWSTEDCGMWLDQEIKLPELVMSRLDEKFVLSSENARVALT